MPTTITSAGITFNDATSLTSALIGTAQIADNAVNTAEIANGAVTAVKLGTNEQKQIAKAWVNFDGTTSPGTIRDSYNVSSVTRNSAGFYTINFQTPMANANYCTACDSSGNNAVIGYCGARVDVNATGTPTLKTTTQCKIVTSAGNAADTSYSSFIAFGN